MPTRIRITNWGLTLALSGFMVCAWAQRTPSPDDPRAVVAETQQNSKKQGMVRVGGVTWKCSNRLCIATVRNVPVGVNTCQALAELVGSLARFGRVSRPIPSYDLALCNVRAQIKLAKIEQERADAEAARANRLPATRAAKPAPLPPPATGAAKPAPAPQPATGIAKPVPAPPVVAAPRSLPVTPAAPLVRSDAPPVVETSPIAPSYRPPVYAIRVMQLAVVGRGALSIDSTPPSRTMPLATAGEEPALVRQSFDVPPLALVGHGRLREVPQGTHLTVTVDKLELVGKSESTP